jgi:hypothetical protein
MMIKVPKVNGKMMFRTGDCYVGDMKGYRLKEGAGTVYTKTGMLLRGTFLNDRVDGKGELLLRDGSTLSGPFKAGEISTGLFKSQNGGEFHGDFSDGVPRKGKYVCKITGLAFEGEFLPAAFFASPENTVADAANKDVMEVILGIGKPKPNLLMKSQTLGATKMGSLEIRDTIQSMGHFPQLIGSWTAKPNSEPELPKATQGGSIGLSSQVNIAPDPQAKKEVEAKPPAPSEVPKPSVPPKPVEKPADIVTGMVGGEKWKEGVPQFLRQGRFKIIGEGNKVVAEVFMGNDEIVC